ncbi:MAG: AMP-binding protein [Polyangiaceae bacterium]
MHVSIPTMLDEYLERNAQKHPEKTALIFKDRRESWGAVDTTANRLAHLLRSLGVARQDRVVLFLDNNVEMAASLWGILRADAIFSPINAQTKVDKLIYMLNDCRARAVVTDIALESVYKEAFTKTPHLKHALVVGLEEEGHKVGDVELVPFAKAIAAQKAERPRGVNIPIDLAAIIYTSGSTGDPKGVMLTHHAMVSATESITTYLENKPDDIVINLLPLSFDYGLYQWINANQFGGTLVLEQSFSYPGPILKRITELKVTGLPVVPTIASILKQYEAKGLVLPTVEYVTNTAAALSGSHIATLKAICPNARIYSMYGLTECKRVSYLPPSEIDRRPDSVGKAMPNLETYIADPATGKRLPPNTPGELVVRSPQVMKGYWEKPESTAKRLKPSPEIPNEMHLFTGDTFRMDEEGYLYFVARTDDIIKSRGEKVSPKEVENVIYGIPGVVDAAVVGRPDDVLGQAVHAYIVVTDEMIEDGKAKLVPAQVQQIVGQKLEPFMVPKFVTFLKEMQKTTSNKISKTNLEDFAKSTYLSGDKPWDK